MKNVTLSMLFTATVLFGVWDGIEQIGAPMYILAIFVGILGCICAVKMRVRRGYVLTDKGAAIYIVQAIGMILAIPLFISLVEGEPNASILIESTVFRVAVFAIVIAAISILALVVTTERTTPE